MILSSPFIVGFVSEPAKKLSFILLLSSAEERLTVNQGVAGSIPAGAARKVNERNLVNCNY